jgi:exodeoxyribonuclease VII small subunit
MKNFDYKTAKSQLDEIIYWFENEPIDVDEAIAKYQQADQLIKDIEMYLNNTRAKIDLTVKKTKSSK